MRPNGPLAIDAEGNCLGRNGTLSTVQIYPENGETVYIVDFTTMGATALAEVEDGVPSLKQVLESPRKKVSFQRLQHPSLPS